VDLKRADRLFPEKFAPATRADLAEFEERLLTAVAHSLAEQPSRAAIGARSSELIALLDDVIADWTAVVLAGERSEPGDTRTQLRAVAQFSSETLSDLVQGMTWTETAGSITALVKLAQQGTAWSYSFTYADPRSGAAETVAGGTSFSSKREAGLRAAAAVWEAAARRHGGMAAGGGDVI
jgi:hypothetical protein